MSAHVPPGWAETEIGSLCDLINGRAFKPSDWTESGLPIVRIQNLNNEDASYNHYDGPVDDRFLIEPGQLLFAWSGTPGTSFGAHIWRGDHAVLNQHIFKVLFDEKNIDKRFFATAINQTLDELIAKAHGGVGLRHVTKGVFEATKVWVPPLNEQRRIVAKLDRLSARSAAARDHLARVEKLAARAKQAILAAAFRGTLTEEWRAAADNLESAADLVARTPEPKQSRGGRDATKDVIEGIGGISVNDPGTELPEGWSWVRLRRIARQETGHTPSRSHPEWWGGDVPWIGIKDANRHHGRVIEETLQTINEDGLANSSARLLPTGTVCLSRTASVGYVTMMGRPMATSQDFATWTCTDALEPKYLLYALMSEGDDIRRFGEGSTHTTIYFPEIRAFHIALAPLEEQREIVRRIEAAFARIDRLTAEAGRAAHLLARLDERLLAKAFRGELVPQDPTDEPAEALLARIRQARVAAPATRRHRTRAAT